MEHKKASIVLTGGHAATTALSTIQALQKDSVDWDISWIGSSRAVEGKPGKTLEFKIFPKLGIPCYGIITGRLQRRFTKHSVTSLMKVPVGFIHAFRLVTKLKPDVVISFGGFAAVPVVVSAWILRIPVVIHEQTIAIGLANKLSIPFATKIAISRRQSANYFPDGKVVLTGNPIQNSIARVAAKKQISVRPVIYATGGSRGSQIFNKHLFEALPKLLAKYNIIHQTGELDLQNARDAKQNLPKNLRAHYEIFDNISPLLVYKVFEKADIVIGRAGANTVAETIATSRPAIFIPIPWSRENEQMKNAKMAEGLGVARVIEQKELTADKLESEIAVVAKNWKKMVAKEDNEIFQLDQGAAVALSTLARNLIR